MSNLMRFAGFVMVIVSMISLYNTEPSMAITSIVFAAVLLALSALWRIVFVVEAVVGLLLSWENGTKISDLMESFKSSEQIAEERENK